jgi:hypothetical protein
MTQRQDTATDPNAFAFEEVVELAMEEEEVRGSYTLLGFNLCELERRVHGKVHVMPPYQESFSRPHF